MFDRHMAVLNHAACHPRHVATGMPTCQRRMSNGTGISSSVSWATIQSSTLTRGSGRSSGPSLFPRYKTRLPNACQLCIAHLCYPRLSGHIHMVCAAFLFVHHNVWLGLAAGLMASLPVSVGIAACPKQWDRIGSTARRYRLLTPPATAAAAGVVHLDMPMRCCTSAAPEPSASVPAKQHAATACTAGSISGSHTDRKSQVL